MARKLGYSKAYEKARAAMLAENPVCVHCGERPATRADHQPPLSLHHHVPGAGCCVIVPSCLPCEQAQAAELGGANNPRVPPKPALVEPEGIGVGDARWDCCPWLDDLRRQMPPEATWPRLMSAPHPKAVGSLGPVVEEWAELRNRQPWRWWQRLAAYRMLEVDADGHLVWGTVLLTVSRQLGKSWLVRDLCTWRMESGKRFGIEQLVVSIAKDVAAVKEMQRPARVMAKQHPDLYRVREVNGQEEIEFLPDASRWMVRSREGVYGLTATLATADEAWKIPASAIEDGLEPTMVERDDAQLILLSTAHRQATSLMIGRRAAALDQLHEPDGTLLLEWAAPPGAGLDDRDGWRLASPQWTPRREKLIGQRIAAALAGECDDVDEPDPVEAVKAQWLNQWPARRIAEPKGNALVDAEEWAAAQCPGDATAGDLWVAVEDDFGRAGAIVAVAAVGDDLLELDGELFANGAEALAAGQALVAGWRSGVASLIVGPSYAGVQDAERMTSMDTRFGLAVIRSLLEQGRLVHDVTPDLDEQLTGARVKESPSGGLALVDFGQRRDLVRAAAWALRVASQPRVLAQVHR